MPDKSPMMRWNQPGGGFSIVQFERDAVKATAASEREGRPIYDEVIRVYITPPGQKNQVVTHELERKFWAPEGEKPRIRRHPVYWNVFKEHLRQWDDGNADALAGTPLSELRALDIGVVASLKEMGIHTVEALANLPDSNLFMGARKWRELARAFLAEAEGQKPLAEMAARLAALEEHNKALQAQMQGMAPVGDDGDHTPTPRRRTAEQEAA